MNDDGSWDVVGRALILKPDRSGSEFWPLMIARCEMVNCLDSLRLTV